MDFKELIGKRCVISKSYCKSNLIEVLVLYSTDDLVKLQQINSENPFWERIKDLKIELIL